MAQVNHGGSLPDNSNKTDFYNIIDTATVSGIVNADVSASAAIAYSKLNLSASITSSDIADGTIVNADINASAAIADTKLANISTAGKVSGASFTSLSSIPSGAGIIPAANLTSTTRIQEFTSSGTFVAPTGVTKVYITGVGGGGAGGGAPSTTGGGGGGAGAQVINYPYTVVAGNSYTVTIGAGGTGGTGLGPDGGATSFDSLSLPGGGGGAGGGAGGIAGATPGTGSLSASGQTAGSFGIPSGSGAAGTSGGSGVGGGGGSTIMGSGGAGANHGFFGSSASANTGAGGGGAGADNSAGGGNGGSGIVIVYY